jgi:hypothetical protein
MAKRIHSRSVRSFTGLIFLISGRVALLQRAADDPAKADDASGFGAATIDTEVSANAGTMGEEAAKATPVTRAFIRTSDSILVILSRSEKPEPPGPVRRAQGRSGMRQDVWLESVTVMTIEKRRGCRLMSRKLRTCLWVASRIALSIREGSLLGVSAGAEVATSPRPVFSVN